MKILVVTAHPEENSFNASLADKSTHVLRQAGDIVTFIDLYKENFDPRESRYCYSDRINPERFDAMLEQRHHWSTCQLPEDIKGYINQLQRADLLILHFPFWWFGMPAILKGWMDRVFVYGGLYNSRQRHENGVMKGKRALMVVTAGASANACGHNGRDGDMRLMLWPALHALQYIGYSVLEPYLIYGVRGGLKDKEQDQQQLRLEQQMLDYENKLISLETWPTLHFNKNEDFTDAMTLRADSPEFSPFIRHNAHSWSRQ